MSETKRRNLSGNWSIAIVATVIGMGMNHSVLASNVESYVAKNCAGCHAISKPDFDKEGIVERMHRKGPLLYYAGDKYNKGWLQNWLVTPGRIRPGGSFPPDHTVVTDDGDVIDKKTLTKHMSVPSGMAAQVAEYLMKLHIKNKPVLEMQYKPGQISPAMGKMNFRKFKGCSACHRDVKDVGGLSAPELYTAWKRMKPGFIVSYIKNPVVWDPHSMMPNRHLKETDIAKLVDYLKLIGDK